MFETFETKHKQSKKQCFLIGQFFNQIFFCISNISALNNGIIVNCLIFSSIDILKVA